MKLIEKLVVLQAGDRNTRVCTVAEIQCYVDADSTFYENLSVKQCNCLPDCFTITYDLEISQAQSAYATDIIELKNSINETG